MMLPATGARHSQSYVEKADFAVRLVSSLFDSALFSLYTLVKSSIGMLPFTTDNFEG